MCDDFIINYNRVVDQLKKRYHPTCGENCLWKPYIIHGKIYRMMYGMRRIGELCSKCNKIRKSEYRHNFCDACAEFYDDEFQYFHRDCATFKNHYI